MATINSTNVDGDSPRTDTTEASDHIVVNVPSWDGSEGALGEQNEIPYQKKNKQHEPSRERRTRSGGSGRNNSNQARRLLSDFSSSFQMHGDKYDEQLLQRAVEDAGRWAYGTILVEVWLMNEARTALYRPEAGWWIDPIYHSDCDPNCQICRLTNRRRKDFVAPAPLAPGVGLPGALWAADEVCGSHTHFQHPTHSASSGQRQSVRNLFVGGDGDGRTSQSVAWREVKALADDPDQPWNPRLQLLAELGLGWAAAVPLRNPDPYADSAKQGIVIYMAREGVDGRRLLSPSNESYLVSASNLIAAALAVRGPRHEAIRERRAEVDSAIRRVRAKILTSRLVGKTLPEVVRENEAKKKQEEEEQQRPDAVSNFSVAVRIRRWGDFLHRKVTTTLKKTRGANVNPPPSFSWKQTLLTFFGVFVTILMLTFWSQFMSDEFGSDYHLVLGPFGALVTLLYGLTAAPASQPKNAILGQLMAVSVSLAFTYAENMHPHLRTSLTTAIVVSAMVKLGLTHPPAGAAALVFSNGLFGWTNMVVLLIGNVMAIGVATIVNNLSDRRQYPTYWGLGGLVQFFRPLDDEEVLKSSARRGFFRHPRVGKGKP